VAQTLPTALSSSIDFVLAPNVSWRFAFRATDGRNNVSTDGFSQPIKYTVIQESHASIAYAGSWTSAARADCLGGAMKFASTNGAQATFTFTQARQVAWIATRYSDRGWAYRWLDGRAIGWLDLNATTLQRRVVVDAYTIADYSATHTVRLWVDGTAGRPNVDIDAFILMQNG
jgi:hypothetical protein